MEDRQYQKYRINLENKKIVSIELNGSKVGSFLRPVTKGKLAKLYVIKSKGQVLYVGLAFQSIRSRLRYGLEAQGKGGYHGYKWKDLREVDVLIWCFPREKKLSRIEAIEAELVYLIRKNTGKWPAYQTEIHFHNVSKDEKDLAEGIFKEAIK